MPIPHKGVRGSPPTDLRQYSPAIKIAHATVVPGGTISVVWFTVTVIVLDMGVHQIDGSGWRVGGDGNLRICSCELIHEQLCRS